MEQRIIALEKRVEKLEEVANDTKLNMVKDKYELKDIIREAVEQGISKVIERMSDIETRVTCLEQKDQKEALCTVNDNKKFTMGIKTTIITVLISGTVGFWIKIFWDFVLTR